MVENGDLTWPRNFWKQPVWWDAMIKAAFLTPSAVALIMVANRGGLTVSTSFWAVRFYDGNAIYAIS
jgi:hypothetical protein